MQTKIQAPGFVPMRPFNEDGAGGTLVPRYSSLSHKINDYIIALNASKDVTQRLAILGSIEEAIKHNGYSNTKTLADTPGYSFVVDQLFLDIQVQYARLGHSSPVHEAVQHFPLARIIASMHPVRIHEFTTLLVKGAELKPKELLAIYPAWDKSPEAMRYRDFLALWSISYLGGSNSQNFLFTNSRDGSEFVLKVENRFDNPKEIEVELRQKLPNLFVPVYAERQVFFSDPKTQTLKSRNLLIMPYTKAKGLYQESRDYRKTHPNYDDFVSHAVVIFEQMAKIMLNIEAAGAVFLDSKTGNWLYDDELSIADTKSFMYSEKGQFHPEVVKKNAGAHFIATIEYNSSKLNEKTRKTAHEHGYVLGKNMYDYLVENVVNGDSSTFKLDPLLVVTSTGKMLYNIMCKLATSKMEDSMSLLEAYNELFILRNPDFGILNLLFKARVDEEDKLFDAYLLSIHERIRKSDPAQKQELLVELNLVTLELEQTADHLKALKALIDPLHRGKEDSLFNEYIKAGLNELKRTPPLERGAHLKEMGAFIAEYRANTDRIIHIFKAMEKLSDQELNYFHFQSQYYEVPIEERASWILDFESSYKIQNQQMMEFESILNAIKVSASKELPDDFTSRVIISRRNKIQALSTDQKSAYLLEFRHFPQEVELVRPLFMALAFVKFGQKDRVMEQYITGMQAQYLIATQEERYQILEKLEIALVNLNRRPMQILRKIIDDFKVKSGFFTVGMQEKASKIEQAAAMLTIEERMAFQSPEGYLKAILEVKRAKSLDDNLLSLFHSESPVGRSSSMDSKKPKI